MPRNVRSPLFSQSPAVCVRRFPLRAKRSICLHRGKGNIQIREVSMRYAFVLLLSLVCSSLPLLDAGAADPSVLLLEQGKAYYEDGKYQAAWDAYDRAVSGDPRNFQVWYRRGQASFKLERYRDAAADFSRSIELNRENHKAWYRRGRTEHELGHYQEAIADFSHALELKSDYDKARYRRGLSKDALGDHAGAREDISRAARSGHKKSIRWMAEHGEMP
ncbi:tetratricopeptide repeat protein [Prosthecochloris sp. ZM_2]|nr:tetratricopeptide repeat protein [Prosthecochloris sp. ZM_2]